MFSCAPEDPFTKWDKVWLDRTRVILQGRQQAEKAIREEKKREAEQAARKAANGN